MKSVKGFLIVLFIISITSCRRDFSCESCPPLATTITKDTLPANYPFATGFCLTSSALGAEIPFHDSARFSLNVVLPDSAMLNVPVAGDQQTQGNCSAWATVYAAGSCYFYYKMGIPYADSTLLSPSYSYNQIVKGECRNCTSIADHLYILETQGACSLKDMPYNTEDCSTQPSTFQKEQAKKYKINNWNTVDLKNIELIKQQIAKKRAVILAINVESELKYIKHPYILTTVLGERVVSHGVIVYGYNDKLKAFRILNSWSSAWGDNGSVWIPYAILPHILTMETGYVITDN